MYQERILSFNCLLDYMAVGAGLVMRFGRHLHAMIVFYIGLNRDRDVGLQGVDRLVHSLHRILLVAVAIVSTVRMNTTGRPVSRVSNTASMMSLVRSRPPRAGCHPMDNDRVERDIEGTGRQTVQSTLITIKVHQTRNIGTGEEESKDRTNKRPPSNIPQPRLCGALKHRSRGQQGVDKETRQPTADKSVVENQRDRGRRLEADHAMSILRLDLGNAEIYRKDKDAQVRGDQRQVKLVHPTVPAGDTDGCHDIDTFSQEQVDNNLGGRVEDNADKDRECTGGLVSVVGLDQHCSNDREEPREEVEHDDEPSGIVDVAYPGPCGLAPKEKGHDGDAEEGDEEGDDFDCLWLVGAIDAVVKVRPRWWRIHFLVL